MIIQCDYKYITCTCTFDFLQLIWQKLVKIIPRDHGSLNQLFTRFGLLPKANKPKDDMHACQDVLLTVFKGHIVAAACRELNIGGPEGDIKDIIVNMSLLNDLTVKVARRFTVIQEAFLNESVPDTGDRVHSYAQILCHFAAIVHLFTDACKEGDGEHVIRCWKLCMLHFHAERKTKYALEALRLQFQLVTLQPNLVHQLTWGRFVNTHGGKGRNIPCDLHNEHVNKLYKEIIGNMGANFTEFASTRAARAVSSLERLALGFERQTGSSSEGYPGHTHSQLVAVDSGRVVSYPGHRRDLKLYLRDVTTTNKFPPFPMRRVWY